MRMDVEQDVRATWPREMVLEFVRQQQRIQGNWPLVGVRGSPSAWRYGEQERVLHDARRILRAPLMIYTGVRFACSSRQNM